MSDVNLDRERGVALEAVRTACRVCSAVRSDMVTPESLAKKDKSPVTVADFASQAVINWHLSQSFPDDPVVAEEDTAQLGRADQAGERSRILRYAGRAAAIDTQAELLDLIARGDHAGGADGRFWTLDPIDGTKGFLRNEQYAVALALIIEGKAVLGVLGCPNLPYPRAEAPGSAGCLFVAERGRRAQMMPLSEGSSLDISVHRVADPRDAVFCESVESGHTSHGQAAQVAAVLGVTAAPLRMDSQCKYAAVARGDASIYLRLPTRGDYEEKIWDHAAGAIIVEAAGGCVTDVTGRPLDFSLGRTLRANRGVVATNGLLHDLVIAALRDAGVPGA